MESITIRWVGPQWFLNINFYIYWQKNEMRGSEIEVFLVEWVYKNFLGLPQSPIKAHNRATYLYKYTRHRQILHPTFKMRLARFFMWIIHAKEEDLQKHRSVAIIRTSLVDFDRCFFIIIELSVSSFKWGVYRLFSQ